MARRRNKRPGPRLPAAPPSRVDAIGLAALALIVVALMVSFAGWQKLGFVARTLSDRLDRLESRVVRASEVATVPEVQPPRQQPDGPDPERVYEIRTAGAPAKGPATAPVTIAEFSDFQ